MPKKDLEHYCYNVDNSEDVDATDQLVDIQRWIANDIGTLAKGEVLNPEFNSLAWLVWSDNYYHDFTIE